MITPLLLGSGTLFLTMSIQIVAVVAIIRYLMKRISEQHADQKKFSFDTYALSVVLLMLFAGHLVQIAIWAQLFMLVGEFDNFSTAYYHSAVNFASLGYGDIVMSEKWRLLGALEASNGVLMFGLSAATMFSVMQKIFTNYTSSRASFRTHADKAE